MIPKDILEYKLKPCMLEQGLCTYPYKVYIDVCLACETSTWRAESELAAYLESQNILPRLHLEE